MSRKAVFVSRLGTLGLALASAFTGFSFSGITSGGSVAWAEEAAAPSPAPNVGADNDCGPFDPDCSKRLIRYLSGLHVAPIQLEGGMRMGDKDSSGVVRFRTDVISLDGTMGDVDALTFEVVRMADREGYRVRFNLEDSEVMFLCTDENGKKHAPFLGIFENCQPDERWGAGTSLLQFQRDSGDARKVMRWAQINAVMNLLNDGNSFDYLHKGLSMFLGSSLDTVWPGTGGSSTITRLNMGMMGMIRSRNNRWEIRGYAGYRPSAVDFDDWGLETRASVIRNVLLSKHVMGSIAVNAEYDHWSRPGNSFGPVASGINKNTRYVGAMFGLRF